MQQIIASFAERGRHITGITLTIHDLHELRHILLEDEDSQLRVVLRSDQGHT